MISLLSLGHSFRLVLITVVGLSLSTCLSLHRIATRTNYAHLGTVGLFASTLGRAQANVPNYSPSNHTAYAGSDSANHTGYVSGSQYPGTREDPDLSPEYLDYTPEDEYRDPRSPEGVFYTRTPQEPVQPPAKTFAQLRAVSSTVLRRRHYFTSPDNKWWCGMFQKYDIATFKNSLKKLSTYAAGVPDAPVQSLIFYMYGVQEPTVSKVRDPNYTPLDLRVFFAGTEAYMHDITMCLETSGRWSYPFGRESTAQPLPHMWSAEGRLTPRFVAQHGGKLQAAAMAAYQAQDSTAPWVWTLRDLEFLHKKGVLYSTRHSDPFESKRYDDVFLLMRPWKRPDWLVQQQKRLKPSKQATQFANLLKDLRAQL